MPFLFKYTVDSLAADPSALTPATVAGVLALTPPALIVGYGVARAGASFCNEARNAVFAQVGRGGTGPQCLPSLGREALVRCLPDAGHGLLTSPGQHTNLVAAVVAPLRLFACMP